MKVGVIKEIWRYPVKSMLGDTVDRCTVSETGLLGDRCWAMRDEQRKEIQWGKMHPQLMLCEARYREEPDGSEIKQVDISFPDGEVVVSDDPRVHEKLTELIGKPATLWQLQPAENKSFYKRYKPDEATFLEEMGTVFAREPGEPMPDLSSFPEVLMDYVSVPGTFFDNEELNLLTTASIAHMQATNPAANWDVRRFRPNFLIDTSEETQEGSEITGLVENEWVGKTLRIGSSVLYVSAPTPRCGMVVQPQDNLPYDKTILRSIVKEADQNLGVGVHCRQAGEIRVGDSVEIITG